jgi:hypothetical protein
VERAVASPVSTSRSTVEDISLPANEASGTRGAAEFLIVAFCRLDSDCRIAVSSVLAGMIAGGGAHKELRIKPLLSFGEAERSLLALDVPIRDRAKAFAKDSGYEKGWVNAFVLLLLVGASSMAGTLQNS